MKFRLREWREEDAQSLTKYANNEKVSENLRDGFPFPYTIKNAERFIKDTTKSNGRQSINFAIEVNGEAAGGIGVFLQNDVYRKSAELGYWLGEPFWGQGITTECAKQICGVAFEKFDIVRIYAACYAYNKGSARVLEKAGFTFEGTLRQSVFKKGEIHDSLMYSLLRDEIAGIQKEANP